MPFFKPCKACGKKKFYVAQRSYVVPKVSPLPITSTGELCGRCFRKIKRVTK